MTQLDRSSSPATERTNELRRGVLGVGAVTFFVVSAAGPLVAIAGGFPVAMMLGNGAGFPAALCIAAATLLLFAIGYTAMARHVTNAGGFYAFVARGLGGTVGGAAALVALVSYNAMQIGIYGMFGAASSGLFADLCGIDLPWWVYVFACMAAVSVLGYRQLDLSVKVLSGLVVAEYIGILLLDVAILRSGGASGVSLTSFTPAALFSGSLPIGFLFCFAAFVGFEATTIYGEEAKDPERTIPLATYFSVLLIGGFYAFSSWCLVVGAGAEGLVSTLGGLKDPTTFVFSLSDHFVGSWLTLLLRILFITSVFAGLLAFHNAAARYFYATGREGILPDIIGVTHDDHQSPHIGSVLQSIIAAVTILVFALCGLDPVLALFSWLTNVGTVGILALMAIASFSVPAFFKRHGVRSNGWTTLILPVVAGAVLSIIVFLAVDHFDILTGESGALAVLLPGIIPAAAIVGALLSMRLKFAAPERFHKLGRNRSL